MATNIGNTGNGSDPAFSLRVNPAGECREVSVIAIETLGFGDLVKVHQWFEVGNSVT